ncbi:Ig-like domain-containing protein [Parvularcula marina]|uniref:Ig-like domain-containing protein n=1 Tax=Parvularcula marina TaxID=2292771 RepID=UPI00351412F3
MDPIDDLVLYKGWDLNFTYSLDVETAFYHLIHPFIDNPKNGNVLLAKAAIAAWSSVTNITFSIDNDSPEIGIYEADTIYDGTVATLLGKTLGIDEITGIRYSDIEVFISGSGVLPEVKYWTYLHELGHAIGLRHPSGDGENQDYNHYTTLMSYNDRTFVSDNFLGYPASPMIFDILAIQSLYGANRSVASGFGGDADFHVIRGDGKKVRTIWDGGGDGDALRLVDGETRGAFLDLRGGLDDSGNPRWSYLGEPYEREYVAIALDPNSPTGVVEIENAIGGSGNDTLIGNALNNGLSAGKGNDRIVGSLGSDQILGGSGVDTLSYNELPHTEFVNLQGEFFILSAPSEYYSSYYTKPSIEFIYSVPSGLPSNEPLFVDFISDIEVFELAFGLQSVRAEDRYFLGAEGLTLKLYNGPEFTIDDETYTPDQWGFNVETGQGNDVLIVPGLRSGTFSGGAGADTIRIHGDSSDYDVRQADVFLFVGGVGLHFEPFISSPGGFQVSVPYVEFVEFDNEIINLYQEEYIDANGFASVGLMSEETRLEAGFPDRTQVLEGESGVLNALVWDLVRTGDLYVPIFLKASFVDLEGNIIAEQSIAFEHGSVIQRLRFEFEGNSVAEAHQNITVHLTIDSERLESEYGSLGSYAVEHIMLDTPTLSGVILDDDGSPGFVLGAGQTFVQEGDGDERALTWTLLRLGDDSSAIGLSAEFYNRAGNLVDQKYYTSGAANQNITLTYEFVGDTDEEANDLILVKLSIDAERLAEEYGANGGLLAQSLVIPKVLGGTIIDDDGSNSPEEWNGWGDPHLVTLDGLNYAFQAVGEFVLTRATSGSEFEVQIRTSPVGSAVSIISAIASVIDGVAVMLDYEDPEQPILTINGVQVDLPEDGEDIAVGAGLIQRDGDEMSFVTAAGETIRLQLGETALAVGFDLSGDRAAGSFEGLLGDRDGNIGDDLKLADGTTLSIPLDFDLLYGDFADAWRVSDQSSLFTYFDGKTTEYYTDRSFPSVNISIEDLPATLLAEATALVDQAGITDPALREAAILDYALTQDAGFINIAATASDPIYTLEPENTPASSRVVAARFAERVIAEGNSNNGVIELIVERAGPADDALTLQYTVSGISTNPLTEDDLVAGFEQGTLQFAVGETEYRLLLEIVGDNSIEADERFEVSLSLSEGSSGYVLANSAVQGVIANDDAFDPDFAVDDALTTDEDTPLNSIDLLANDLVDSLQNATLELIDTSGLLGELTDNGDGTFTYNPNGQFEHLADGEMAVEQFTYRVSAGGLGDVISINGDEEGFNAGWRVASGGDVNGDGYDDILIGAASNGDVYLVLGSETGVTLPSNSDSLRDVAATVFVGLEGSFLQGADIADVNGDGIGDIILGDPGVRPEGASIFAGRVYVIYGTMEGYDETVNVEDISVGEGYFIDGPDNRDVVGGNFSAFGRNLRAGGDLNGDGIGDIIVTSDYAYGGDGFSGRIFTIFGQAGTDTENLNLNDLDGDNGFAVNATRYSDEIGRYFSTGDINGDGIDDLLIGQPQSRFPGEQYAYDGAVYVVYGSDGDISSELDLDDLDGENGFILRGPSNFGIGQDVMVLGDLNADGIEDMVFKASANAIPNSSDGEIYIVFGTEVGTTAIVELEALDPSRIILITSENIRSTQIINSGDFNGDELVDLLFYNRDQDSYSVLLGSPERFTSDIQLDELGEDEFVSLQLAHFVRVATGDLNGDGLDDIISSDQFASPNGLNSAGTVEIILGSSQSSGVTDDATVTVTIAGINDAPIAVDDERTTSTGATLSTIAVLENDSDVEGDTLNVTDLDTSGTLGVVTDNGDGTFAYDPNGQFEALGVGQTATDSFTYTISDGNGGTATASVIITITGEDDAPQGEGIFRFGTVYPDSLMGTEFIDAIFGIGGDDTIEGLGGGDVLSGGAGQDLVDGGDGNDILYGDAGNDTLIGGAGNDTLYGGGAYTGFVADTDDDLLIGGAGSDTFSMFEGANHDIIQDFEVGIDSISFALTSIENFAALMISNTEQGALVAFGASSLLLQGVAASELSESDFVF